MSPSEKSDQLLSVTVVICTHNRPAILERCLQAVQRLDYPEFSSIVVDSAPISTEAQALAARYDTQYCVSPVKGLSRARNIGTRATRGAVVAYLDDDMVPHAGWLGSLIDEFSEKNVGAVTGPVLPLELRALSNAELQPTLESAPLGPLRSQIDRTSPQWFERANFGGIGDGNFALRRDAFERLGGFDERLGRGVAINSGEEHYAFFKLLSTGSAVTYTPHAVVFHPSPLASLEYRRKLIAEAIAYAAFLMSRHPTQVWRIVNYFAEGLFRARRPWRTSQAYDTRFVAPVEAVSGGVAGFSAFLQSLYEGRKFGARTDAQPVLLEPPDSLPSKHCFPGQAKPRP
jgi:glycosyltransferase involved in cell wall biosynthesis